jgi:hypothetical protein
MPNGFPPPSFVVETERVSTFAGILAGPRGRWLAAAAILGAVLLIAGILLIARRGGDNTALKSGPTSTRAGDTSSTLSSETSVLDPTATLPDASTLPGGATVPTTPTLPAGASTLPGGTTLPPAGPAPPPGVLTPQPAAVAFGTVYPAKAGAGSVSGQLGLKNTGTGPLDYTSQVGSGISVNPPGGSIAPGATTAVTVTFNGAGLPEGDYSGRIIFGGSGGSKTVPVTSRVALPPAISSPSSPNFVEPTFGSTACTAPWKVAAAVSPAQDPARNAAKLPQSPTIQHVFVRIARGAAAPVESEMAADPGRPGIWTISEQPETPPPSTKLTVRAIDSYGAESTSPEMAVTC